MIEIWKDVVGYEGIYQVSNLGNVKSLIGYNGKKYISREKLLSKTLSTAGYYKVELFNKKERKSFRVHRLVAIAFIENPLNKEQVNHIDGNKLNNNVENLEWNTPKENVRHSIDTGLKVVSTISREELNKLYLSDNFTIEKIANIKNMCRGTVSSFLKLYGIKERKKGYHLDKYNIDLDLLLEEFKSGYSNMYLSKKYKCNPNLIARRKYQFKQKGEL